MPIAYMLIYEFAPNVRKADIISHITTAKSQFQYHVLQLAMKSPNSQWCPLFPEQFLNDV